jgi:hypothetical protein
VATSIRFQLVLQFPASSLADYDALVALESQLQDGLGESANVDGHDMGAGQANIFIITHDPEAAFRRVLPLLQSAGRLDDCTAAYRETAGAHYRVLWPKNFTGDFTVE